MVQWACMDASLRYTDLPEEFSPFEELRYYYPDLSSSDWRRLAEAINIPVRRIRVKVSGRAAGKCISGFNFDEVETIKKTYSELRAAALEEEEREEQVRIAAQEQQERDEQAARLAAIEAKRIAEQTAREQAAARQAELIEQRRIADEIALKGPIAKPGTISSRKLAIELGIAQETLDTVAAKNGINSRRYRYKTGPGGAGYNQEQSEVLRAIFNDRGRNIATDDDHSLASISREYNIGRSKLIGILDELGIEPKRRLFDLAWGYGIKTAELEALEKHLQNNLAKPAPKNVKSIYKWAMTLGISPSILHDLAVGIGITPRQYRFDGHDGFGLSRAHISLIKEAYSRENLASILPISINDAARVRKIAPATMIMLSREFGIELKTYRFGNKSGLGITPDQLVTFDERYAQREIVPVPDNYKSIKQHARPRKMTEKILLRLAEGAGVKPKKYSVGGLVTDCLSDDDIARIEQAYSLEKMKLIKPITIREFAHSQRSKPEVIHELALGAGIEFESYMFGGKFIPGITPSQIDELSCAYEGLPRAPFSDETVFPLSEIAKEEGIDYRTLRKLFDSAGVEITSFRFPNGREYPGVKREQVMELKQVYEPLLTI